jgi:hypothetical protein
MTPAGRRAATPDVEQAVRELLGPGAWRVTPVRGAAEGGPWSAVDRRRLRFVKAGTNARLLRRLSRLGVSPRVLGSRPLGSGDLVVQQHVAGEHPDERWVDEHVAAIGRLVAVYHADRSVRGGARPLASSEAVERLRRRVDDIEPSSDLSKTMRATLETIASTAPHFPPGDAVLTHGDPNTSNLISATGGGLYLVDWDEARVSDPVRDIGQVLWWYVRPGRWGEGLDACGLPDDDATRRRIHWWVAAESLDVALGLLERGAEQEGEAFALDAAAAAAGRPNPRAWWSRDGVGAARDVIGRGASVARPRRGASR